MAACFENDEPARLQALHRYKILDTLPEKIYDDIVELARLICDAPICAISFVDADRQWFKARSGLSMNETGRDISFCAHAIAQDSALFEIPDARADVRFADNPLVTGEPYIRFYAGAPIVDATGRKLGALSVMDHEPRRLSPAQRQGLAMLARQVAELLHGRAVLASLLEKERFKCFLDNSPVVAFLKEAQGPMLYVNQTFFRIFGKTPADVFGKPYSAIWPPDFARRMTAQDREVIREKRTVVCEYDTGADQENRQFWQIYKFPVADGPAHLIGGIAIDITHERLELQQLEREVDRLGVLSNTDALTGVANRRALDERLRTEVDFSRRHKEPLSFLMVDIDRFKAFNDRFGHLAGDRLLASIAQTLAGNSRRHDIVGRYGGEEFGVILRHTGLQSASAQAERLRRAIEKMPPQDVTVSIGVAEFDFNDPDAEKMVSAADNALYAAKEAGKNCVFCASGVVFTAAPAKKKPRSRRNLPRADR